MATSRRFPRFNCNRHALSLLCFLKSVLERVIVVICLRVANACNIFVRCLMWAGIPLLEDRFGCRVLGSFVDLNIRNSPARVANIFMHIDTQVLRTQHVAYESL